MTSHPVASATAMARSLLSAREDGQTIPSRTDLLSAIRRFQDVDFDVPRGGDADGLLFQYGSVSWFPEPTFLIGVTRQLEVVDEDGEHETYVQVELSYHYAETAELRALEAVSEWWFPEEGVPLDSWLARVAEDPVWRLLDTFSPRGFFVSEDMTG